MTLAPETRAVPAHVPPERVVDFDYKASPSLGGDPHGRIRAARDRFPEVCFTARNGGHWLVYGRANLHEMMKSPEVFSSQAISLDPDTGPMRLIPLQLDPPEHTPYRHLLLKHFGLKEMRALEPFIRSWAERLIKPLASQGGCDFVKAVAEPMAISVFMEIMGLPLDRFEEFRALALASLDPYASQARREALHGQIYRVIGELIADRAWEPRDDLVSRLLAETIEGRRLRRDEVLAIGFLLFLAGLDTVTNAMTYGIRHIAEDMELQERLREDLAGIPPIIDELLRRYTFVNPVRIATRDTTLGGATIRAGDRLVGVLWSGSNAQGFDSASAAGQFAFGSGPHTCLGLHLARLELRVMYEVWFSHIGPFWRGPEPPGSVRGGMIMAVTSLPLCFDG